MAHIGILVNPLSGTGNAVELGNWLATQLACKEISHSLFVGNWPQMMDTFTDIWIVGGDGTVNYFLNHYTYSKTALSIFKGGTGNDFHWKLYGDISREEQFEKILSATARPIDAACCNNQIYINSSGIGFDGEVLRSMKAIRKLGGHIGYLWVVLKKIFSYREPEFSITVNGKQWHGKYLLVSANNSSRTGGGFLVTPKALLDDAKLDLLLCKPLGLFKRLLYLPKIETGKHLALSCISYFQATDIKVSCEFPLYAQLDGELIKEKTFHYTVLPAYLMIK
ncbi:MAG: hypothetical protein IPL97_01830 [Niastella sp.]|nr:hypothetical protein [Niastella sp.]